MWDEEDGFYYDVLRLPDGSAPRLKVRSMVGLLPLCATTVIEPWQRDHAAAVEGPGPSSPDARTRDTIHPTGPGHLGIASAASLRSGQSGAAATDPLEDARRERVPSPYGIRSLSRYHESTRTSSTCGGQEYRVGYLPAESDTGMFGGNSNWRGPIWMPVNA